MKIRTVAEEYDILKNEYVLYKVGEKDTFESNGIKWELTKLSGSHDEWVLETTNTGFTKYFKDVFEVLDFLEERI